MIYVTAPWCQPCKKLWPIARKLAAETGVELERLDVEVEPERAAEYGVASVPALVVDGVAVPVRTAMDVRKWLRR